MDRRDALKSLATLAGATGMSVTPVTAKDAEQCVLIILKPKGLISLDQMQRLREVWKQAITGTALEGVPTVVQDESVDVEFVRR